jgi:hypothetical protein
MGESEGDNHASKVSRGVFAKVQKKTPQLVRGFRSWQLGIQGLSRQLFSKTYNCTLEKQQRC